VVIGLEPRAACVSFDKPFCSNLGKGRPLCSRPGRKRPLCCRLGSAWEYAAGWGEMASGKKGRGVILSSINTLRAKADHSRDTAARLRDMAEGEPVKRLRTLLLDLARQYEELAEKFRAR
jgi:hypothetical protein